MTPTPRQQYLLAEVKAGIVTRRALGLARVVAYIWRIDRPFDFYPRAKRQPSTREMRTLHTNGLIRLTHGRWKSVAKLTAAGRKAMSKIGG